MLGLHDKVKLVWPMTRDRLVESNRGSAALGNRNLDSLLALAYPGVGGSWNPQFSGPASGMPSTLQSNCANKLLRGRCLFLTTLGDLHVKGVIVVQSLRGGCLQQAGPYPLLGIALGYNGVALSKVPMIVSILFSKLVLHSL
jgi:hypothetical protein